MNTFMNRAVGVAALALAALPLVAVPFAAHAQDEYRIRVGDLTQPAQAAAFNRQIDALAGKMCANYQPGTFALHDEDSCKQQVRDEAMSQLTRNQRIEFAQAASSSTSMGRVGQ